MTLEQARAILDRALTKSVRMDDAELRRLAAINAELVDALEKISKIPNQQFGPDWEEIDEARLIAITALEKAKQ